MAFHTLAPHSPFTSYYEKPCYDVFINHHGKDVKDTLASAIYQRLRSKEVQVFLDKPELRMGDSFPQAIEEAMLSASLHIAIFSPAYAESPWCLEELSFMLKIKVEIIPVFFRVNPSDLRFVTKEEYNGAYAGAFLQHERKDRYTPQKIKEWKEALISVSYLFGLLDADKGDEGELVTEIVNAVLDKMKKVPLPVATHPVGLDKAVQDFETKVGSSVRNKNVQIVGIVGMGGSGKTTLAKELYNRKCSSIVRSCFLSNVSTNTLHYLQNILLDKLRITHSPVHDKDEGMGMLIQHLRFRKVLIVLDDVNDVNQMECLLPELMLNNLGRDSFIIVTTRDKDVFASYSWEISIYEMKPLDTNNAEELFCRHAFPQPYSHPALEFQDLIKKFVEACNGLPLSLKVLGAMVKGKSEAIWEE